MLMLIVPVIAMCAAEVTARQVMLFVQILLARVAVQVVDSSLIVAPVLMIHMVYAGIQHVVVILAVKHMIMGYIVLSVNPVVVDLVLMLRQVPLGMVALQHIIVVMGLEVAQHLALDRSAYT